jgi:hypothetical protein
MQMSMEKPDPINQVWATRQRLVACKTTQEKRRIFDKEITKLSDEAQQLFAFSCWFCFFNTRFIKLDPSEFYHLTPGNDPPAWEEFEQLLKDYQHRRVTQHRSGELNKFLLRCPAEIQDFYLSLFAKTFVKGLPLLEAQQLLGDIDYGQFYSATVPQEPLQPSEFAGLNYPLVLTWLPAEPRSLGLYLRTTKHETFLTDQDGHPKRSKNPLQEISPGLRGTRAALFGMLCDDGAFIPFEAYSSLMSYKAYRKEKIHLSLQQRAERLGGILESTNLGRHDPGRQGFANDRDELLDEIIRVTKGRNKGFLLITDQGTARGGPYSCFPTQRAFGIIGGYWSQGEECLGFKVWFNGERLPVSFPLHGKNNSLLNNITQVKGKVIDFLYLKINDRLSGVGQEIRWNEEPWRTTPLLQHVMWIEKCAFCGGTKTTHERRGVCTNCERNFYYYLNRYGEGIWFTPDVSILKRRLENCWEPRFLNNVGYFVRNFSVEARDDGRWRFIDKEKQDG